jgi:murein DD-endopeptidase MepM/ murein hydrolase activator NlpD
MKQMGGFRKGLGSLVTVWLFLGLGILPALMYSCGSGSDKTAELVDSASLRASRLLFGICVDSLEVVPGVVERGQTLSDILISFGFTPAMVHRLVVETDTIFDVKKVRAGQPYTAMLSPDSLRSLRYLVYEKTQAEYVVFDLDTARFRVYHQQKEIRVERRTVRSAITSSLWNAVKEQKAKSELTGKLSDIYAWQIDFFGIAAGDSFAVVYDQLYVDTLLWEIGDIHVAYFRHHGKDYYAIPFVEIDSVRKGNVVLVDTVRTFFDENGQSLRKAFLKSPLNFSRISSGFTNSRFHPVLKYFRAHHGVDYAAPTGTPVWSIGEGVVTRKAYQRAGGGHYLYIKHNATYTTSYMHLSRYAAGINIGTRVRQGQVIGYVGRSGLATGPHLDFRVYKNGSPINPLKMESPPPRSLREKDMPRFQAVRDSLIRMLKVK